MASRRPRKAETHASTTPPRAAVSAGEAFCLSSPAWRFFTFLLVDGLGDDDVRVKLADLGLDPGDSGYVGRLRNNLKISARAKRSDRQRADSRAVKERLGLAALFDDAEGAKRAMALLTDRRAREVAEALIIAGAPEKAIAMAVAPIRADVTPGTVHAFAKSFFDITEFTRGDLRVVFELRADREIECARRESAAAAVAVTRRWRFDARRVALDLPQGAPFAQVALLAAGVDVHTHDPAALLRRIRDRAVLRATERVHRHTRRDAQTCLTYIEIGLRTTELIERVQDPQDHLLDELRRVALTTSDRRVPSIHELAGNGQFTTDVGPVDLDDVSDAVDKEDKNDKGSP